MAARAIANLYGLPTYAAQRLAVFMLYNQLASEGLLPDLHDHLFITLAETARKMEKGIRTQAYILDDTIHLDDPPSGAQPLSKEEVKKLARQQLERYMDNE